MQKHLSIKLTPLLLAAALTAMSFLAKAQCPTNYTFSANNTTICQGSTVTLTLGSSQTFVSYQLYSHSILNNQPQAIGSPVNGTGGGLQWTDTPASTWVYYVVATSKSFICNGGQVTSANATVVVNIATNPYNVQADICGAPNATITLSGSDSNVSYQLLLNGSPLTGPLGSPVTGNGSPINWTGASQVGTYSVLATNPANGCTKQLGGVTVNASPQPYSLSGPSTVCQGASTVIGQSNSEANFSYELWTVDAGGSTSQIAGQSGGGSLTWTIYPETTLTYFVIGRNSMTGCSKEMANRLTISVNPSSSLWTVNSNVTCATNATISLSGSNNGISYQLLNGTSPYGASQLGNNSSLNWAGINTAGTFTVKATNPSNGCSRQMSGSVLLNPLPQQLPLSGPTSTCPNTVTTLTLGNSSSPTSQSVTYMLYKIDGSNTTTSLWNVGGNGGSVTWTFTPSGSATYYVIATTAQGCQSEMANRIAMTVSPVSITNIQVPNSPGCNSVHTINATASPSNAIITWSRPAVGSIAQAAASGTGNVSEPLTNTSIYSVTVPYTITASLTGCSVSQNVNVTVDPIPAITNAPVNTSLCSGSSFSYVANANSSGTTITWTRNTSGISPQSSSGSIGVNEVLSNTTSGSINAVYIFTLSNTGCSNTQYINVRVNPLPTLSINPPGPSVVCQGASLTLSAVSPDGTVYNWSTGSTTQSTSVSSAGSYSVTVTNPNTNCSSSASTTVSVFNTNQNGYITTTPSNTLCSSPVTLQVNGYGIPVRNVQWTTGATTQAIQVTVPGGYGVTYQRSFLPFVSACQMISACSNPGARIGADELEKDPEKITAIEDAISIFPNPSDGEISIEFQAPLAQEASIQLTDLLLNSVHQSTVPQNGQLKKIDVKSLTDGIYLLKIESSNASVTRKVLVNHK
jgi:hypothetical protein